MVFQGLNDDAHVVVKQSLVAFDSILPHLLKHQQTMHCRPALPILPEANEAGSTNADIVAGDVAAHAAAAGIDTTTAGNKTGFAINDNDNDNDDGDTVAPANLNKISSDLTGSQLNNTKDSHNVLSSLPLQPPSGPPPPPLTTTTATTATPAPPSTYCDGCYGNNKNNVVTIENVIHGLQLVFENKYWVVQCKYCDLISKLDFQIINAIYGCDQGHLYEVSFNYK